MTSPGLFGDLPAVLPEWDTVAAIEEHEEAACRRLERRGLVKVHRWKLDYLSAQPRLFAGKLPASRLRMAAS